MRFSNPSSKIINRLFRLVKRIYRKDFEEFIKNIKQRIFYISNKELSVVVVYGTSDGKIEIFNDKESLLTCHALFSGDEKSLDYYGYNYLSIEPVEFNDELYKTNQHLYDQTKYFNLDSGAVIYFSNKSGQQPSPVTNDEALVLIDVLEYLLEIKRLFDEGIEAVPETNEDCVLCFEFDDDQLLYTSSYITLSSFDFLPNIKVKTHKNPRYIEKLKEFPINPGTLYLGQTYLPYVADCFEYDNHVKVMLNDILLYGATDTGVFDYSLYTSRKKNSKKTMKDTLIILFDRIGLFDLIVTDNYVLYLAIVDDLKALNIEVTYDPFNRFNGFIYPAIKSFIQFEFDQQMINQCLSNLKDTYSLIMYDIETSQGLFDEEIEEEIDDDSEIDVDSHLVS